MAGRGGIDHPRIAGTGIAQHLEESGKVLDAGEREPMNGNILVVDDEEGIRELLAASLGEEGYTVFGEPGGEGAEQRIRTDSIDCVLLDLVLPGRGGMETLEALLTSEPELPVVMMTGHASVETAVRAMRQGAFDYLVKPLRMEAVSVVVSKAMESRRLRQECHRLRRQVDDRHSARTLIGTSDSMREIFRLIPRVAPSFSPVLTCGEAGVGKGRVIRALHEGGRPGTPFVTVDCTTMDAAGLETALFGKPGPDGNGGAISRAGSGSLFLRDVGAMPLAVQARFAEFLEARNSPAPRGPDRKTCRVMASSRTNLDILRKEGRFREDLFYRLHVVCIDIPPLRERREDIPAYLTYFLKKTAESLEIPTKTMSTEARAQIMDYPWPGNVRQLENAVERAFSLAYGREVIVPQDLPAEVQAGKSILIPWLAGKAQGDSLPEILTAFEQQMLLQALERSNWVKTRAAAILKIKRTTLIEKMKRLGIPLKDGRWQSWA